MPPPPGMNIHDGIGNIKFDKDGNPFAQFKPGTRFCLPTKTCDEMAESWGYGEVIQ